MANAQKVANIFEQASAAFGRLAQLTVDLRVSQAQADHTPSNTSRWTLSEMEMLKDAINRFGTDLNKIAQSIESKSMLQIKHKLQSKAFQEAGLGDAPTDEMLAKLHEKSRTTGQLQVDRGRRKQMLDQIPEEYGVQPKRLKFDLPTSPGVPLTKPLSGDVISVNLTGSHPLLEAEPHSVEPAESTEEVTIMEPLQKSDDGDPPMPQNQPLGATLISRMPVMDTVLRESPASKREGTYKYEDYDDQSGDSYDPDEEDEDISDAADEDDPYYSEEEG